MRRPHRRGRPREALRASRNGLRRQHLRLVLRADRKLGASGSGKRCSIVPVYSASCQFANPYSWEGEEHSIYRIVMESGSSQKAKDSAAAGPRMDASDGNQHHHHHLNGASILQLSEAQMTTLTPRRSLETTASAKTAMPLSAPDRLSQHSQQSSESLDNDERFQKLLQVSLTCLPSPRKPPQNLQVNMFSSPLSLNVSPPKSPARQPSCCSSVSMSDEDDSGMSTIETRSLPSQVMVTTTSTTSTSTTLCLHDYHALDQVVGRLVDVVVATTKTTTNVDEFGRTIQSQQSLQRERRAKRRDRIEQQYQQKQQLVLSVPM